MRRATGITPFWIKYILDFLKSELKNQEPLDDFSFCDKKKLSSCLKTPFQRPIKSRFREEVIDKTSVLFFLLIENHVLPTNGNKRLAVQSMLTMLYSNNYNIRKQKNETELYDLTLKITKLCKERISAVKVLKLIRGFLRKNIYFMNERNIDWKKLRKDFETFLIDSNLESNSQQTP